MIGTKDAEAWKYLEKLIEKWVDEKDEIERNRKSQTGGYGNTNSLEEKKKDRVIDEFFNDRTVKRGRSRG